MSELEDKDPGRDALLDCFGELCERMDGEGLRRHLFSARLLTVQQNSEARDSQVKPTKNEVILDAILKRSKDDIMRFCELLFEKNQPYCGKLLMDAFVRNDVDVSKLRKLNRDIGAPVPAHCAPQYTYHLQQLTKPFASLMVKVKQVVSKYEELATLAITLLKNPKHRDEDVKKAIADIQLCVKEGRKDDVFIQLQPFLVDHIDLHLLESLIEVSCEDTATKQYAEEQKIDLKQELDAYKKEVKKACESTLEDCEKTTIDGRPQNGLSVGMQTSYPPNDVTIGEILALKKYLVEDIGVGEAHFDGFSCSDVTLFFSIDIKRLPFIIHWCFIHRRDLMDKFHVSLVFVPGHFVYSMAADQEYPFPEVYSIPVEWSVVAPEVDGKDFTQLAEMLDATKTRVEVLEEKTSSQLDEISLAIKNGQMALNSKQIMRDEELRGKIAELQKLTISLAEKASEPQLDFDKVLARLQSIEHFVQEGEAANKTTDVSLVPIEQSEMNKVLEKLSSLEDILRKQENDEKDDDIETEDTRRPYLRSPVTISQFKSLLNKMFDGLYAKVIKHDEIFGNFVAEFKTVGEEFVTKFGEQVLEQLRTIEDPFQMEIPIELSNIIIGTRGQTLRRIEKKTGVLRMSLVPSNKEGFAFVTLFGDISACKKAKVEVHILLANNVSIKKKDMIFLTRYSGEQMLSFASFKAREHVPFGKQYCLKAVGEKVMSEGLRSIEILSRCFSEVTTEVLKSPEIPQVVIEVRFGRLFWKTNHALTRDDLERKYPLEELENKDGQVHVEDKLSTSHWTFQTVCESSESEEKILVGAKNLGLVSIGEMETFRISFVHIPDEPGKEYVLYGLNARMCENGKFKLVHITPRMKKEILFDCLPLEGNLDIRMALSIGPVCSEKDSKEITKLASEITSGLSVKDGSLYLQKSYQECRIFHVRRSKKKLYLMHHEDHQYIVLDCNVEDCNAGRQNLDDDATQYPLKDHHREIELLNCQWLADFASLEGKDWKDFFISSGCDVSQISVIPKPVKPETIVEELGPFVRCALRIAQS